VSKTLCRLLVLKRSTCDETVHKLDPPAIITFSGTLMLGTFFMMAHPSDGPMCPCFHCQRRLKSQDKQCAY
jgi:Na+-translocating ferredoxin:NAD+ oxidoreductase RnfD subunit